MDYKTYTVGELIKALNRFSHDLPVRIRAGYDGGDIFNLHQEDVRLHNRDDDDYDDHYVNGLVIRASESDW